MLAIVPILLITLLQILGYLYLDQKGWSHWKLSFPLLFIPLYIFVIGPIYVSYYYVPLKENVEFGCGMPVFSMFIFFVVFGLSGLLLTHVLYWVISKVKKRGLR